MNIFNEAATQVTQKQEDRLFTDIYDIKKFIDVNNLDEITNPITFKHGTIPTPDGLLSTEIFGRTPDDRRLTYAYINLHGHFLHPLAYKNLLRLDRRFESIIAGNLNVSIATDGSIVEDENGDTGLEFLYKNWKKIKLKKGTSTTRNERVELIESLKLDELFVSYWVVCPAFYRDVQINNSNDKMSYHEINEFYTKLIRLSKSIENDIVGIPLIGHTTRNRIQKILIDIYNNFINEVKGKNGLFRKAVLGKSVDYGARLVISMPKFNVKHVDDMMVDFYHCGVPLATVCVLFYPYIFKWVKDFFYNELVLNSKKMFRNKETGKIESITVKNIHHTFNDEYIEKCIDLYIHSYADRFKTIPVPNEEGKNLHLIISGYYRDKGTGNAQDDSSSIMTRYATWTDILYMAACEVTKDKHVMITRYPVADYFNIFPNKIRVLSTNETRPVVINGKVYPYYPVINLDLPLSEVSTMFIDTLNISNLYLKGLGGDYDGDE